MTPILYVILCIAPVAVIFALALCRIAARADELSEKVMKEMEAKQ